MVRFLARRLAMGLIILLVLSVLMYVMLDLAMDPLDDLRTSTAPNKEAAIAARIQALHLDQPWWQRYLDGCRSSSRVTWAWPRARRSR